ncbi:MAG: hypothetical protein AB1486_28715 [Planctomycetota bacterium]
MDSLRHESEQEPIANPVAAIDVGSHSAKLLIAHRGADGRPRPLHFELRPTGLGRSLEASGVITQQAWDRARSAVTAFLEQAREFGVADLRAVGTEALRRSPGAEGIVEAFREVSGHPIEIISGAREAELSARALDWDGVAGERVLASNVGGASTELMLVERGRLAHQESIPIGAATLTEQCQPDHGPQGIALLLHRVSGAISESRVLAEAPGCAFVGMGGTIAHLAAIDQGLTHTEPEAVQGHVIPAERLVELVSRLARMNVEERIAKAHIPADRAPVIVAGGMIFVVLALVGRFSEVRTSSRGLVHGLVLEMLEGRPR